MKATIEEFAMALRSSSDITSSVRWGGSLEPFSYQEIEHQSSVESYGEPVLALVRLDFIEPGEDADKETAV